MAHRVGNPRGADARSEIAGGVLRGGIVHPDPNIPSTIWPGIGEMPPDVREGYGRGYTCSPLFSSSNTIASTGQPSAAAIIAVSPAEPITTAWSSRRNA
jgi:hypothetical protein